MSGDGGGHGANGVTVSVARRESVPTNCSRTDSGANRNLQNQLRTRRNVAKMLIAIVIMFSICFLPVHLLSLFQYVLYRTKLGIITSDTVLGTSKNTSKMRR